MQLAVYGSDAEHADIASSYNNIGGVYSEMGEYSKTLEYYRKGLEMQLVVYGSDTVHAHIAVDSVKYAADVYYNRLCRLQLPWKQLS
ncbi:hypothetical protein EB796_010834 [Bugula neritina]|uniref:Uncharacterized protein n=1 Tax=Bugula neritina TaxID=10212 RepID=A0A7J7JYW0_BUGNE|nr:hypothetical protein EB796_010834 [Bugula neritina]